MRTPQSISPPRSECRHALELREVRLENAQLSHVEGVARESAVIRIQHQGFIFDADALPQSFSDYGELTIGVDQHDGGVAEGVD